MSWLRTWRISPGALFGIESELRDLQARHHELAPLYSVKRKFVQRKALTGYTPEKAAAIDGFAVAAELEAFLLEPLTERSFAEHVDRWLRRIRRRKPSTPNRCGSPRCMPPGPR